MHLKLIALTILFTAMCLGANTAQSQASDNDADMIFVGGEFYTANPRQPWASAVAVRGDSIIYVGDEAGAADFVGPATRQYQLNDALVIPGIVDAHTHPGLVARSADNLQLADSRTQEELMAAIAAMVKDHPQREIIVGGGWDNDLFGKRGPHKNDLDRIGATAGAIRCLGTQSLGQFQSIGSRWCRS